MSAYPIPQPIFDTLENFTLMSETLSGIHYPTDFTAAAEFLKQYNSNKATFESYRREIERLIQWSWHIHKSSILLLKRQDIEQYLTFCLNPPSAWIGLNRAQRFINTENNIRRPNPQWRPFVCSVTKQCHKNNIKPDKKNYQLSQKAIREIFTVLNSFYQYLLIEEKVIYNPIALIRQKTRYIQKRQSQTPVMRLSEIQWQYCLETAEKMAQKNPLQHERMLFMIHALYLLYLRISELAASNRWIPEMGHFYKDSQNNWWFKTVGKGNKIRDIAVSDSMLSALQRYRLSLNLTALPSPGEKIPLISKKKGKGPITSTRHIRKIIQECFDNTVNLLRAKNLTHEADMMETSTVHWLRHTGISDDINKRFRPVSHVRIDAGHSSEATTQRYNDIELTERHKSAKLKKT